MKDNEKKLKQYFLGILSDEESEKIDLQIISGKSPSDELALAEDDLMEEYLDEYLTDQEIEFFYKNFLISEDRKQRLDQIVFLRNYAQRHLKQNVIETKKEETEGFFLKLARFFALNQRPSTAILGFLIFTLSGFIFWQIFFNMSGSETSLLAKNTVELNKRDLNNLEELKNFKTFSLFSGSMRSGNAENVLQTENLTENVLLRLAIPSDLNGVSAFNVKLSENEKDLILLNQVPAYENKNGKELRILLPESFFKKGNYKIKILPENDEQHPLNYSFVVN